MAYIFYGMGWIALIAGLGWSLIVASASGHAGLSGYAITTALIVIAPGLGVAVSGMLLLAIGGILARLDTIVRYSRDSYELSQDGGANPAARVPEHREPRV